MFSVWSWKGRSEEQGKIGKVDMKGFSIEAGRSIICCLKYVNNNSTYTYVVVYSFQNAFELV